MSVDQRIANLESELAALKAEREAEKNPPAPEMITVFDGWKPNACSRFYYPYFDLDRGTSVSSYVPNSDDELLLNRCAAFKTEAQAEAVADAIFVMLELRNQPGAGKSTLEGGWALTFRDGTFRLNEWFENKYSFICPCFPTKELCVSALDAVGRDRVERALQVWGMMPVEVQS